MRISIQKWLGIAGLIALLVAVQLGAVIRHENWSGFFDPQGWLWAILPAALMGIWGWISLVFSSQAQSKTARLGLIGLSVFYFGLVAFLSYDIVANGNSTAGITFFFLPIFATIGMLPTIGFISWLGRKIDKSQAEKEIAREGPSQ